MIEAKPNYYAVIPADVRYCKDLPPNAKLLYGELTALASKEGYCWASNEYFSELYNVDKSTISRWVSRLAELGFIKVFIEENYHRKIYIAMQKDQGGYSKKSRGATQKSQYINTINNKDNNTNKNIEENSNIQSSIFRNTEGNVSKLNVLSTINNKEEVPRIEGSEETDPRPPIESPKNHDRIDVEKNLGAELGKGSQNNEESLKIETIRERDNFMQQLSGINSVVRGNPPPELVEFIDSKQKLAKPIIDAFYGYFKTLNNFYGQEMKWDAKETKILKTQLLEAGIPIDRLLMWKPDFRSQDNPYYQVLEPAWRLKTSRDKKNSDFFKKIFRPSTFTVKYTECLEPINYYKETVEEEDPNLDSKLEELNKKLIGE